ncbi:hypothetical protein [Streptomyces sp.]|uniref:hypothetical protein n=1 Tax=Streptomyces sp. TaxID=1931 RepID=UPI002F948DE7
MISRLAATLAAGVLVATGLATSATAAAPFTDTVRIAGNFDNGEHGYWARPTYSRTVTITPSSATNVWNVALRDAGTFTTIPGAKSPQAGVTLGSPVRGTFSGTFDFTVTSEAAPTDALVRSYYNFACDGTVPNRGRCPGMPQPTGNWPALYFPAGAQVSAGAWRWEYRTCAERWVNGSAGNSGDITGKRCDRTVHADEPTVVQPECGTTRGKLVIPSDRGVTYRASRDNGRYLTLRAGSYDVRPAVYRVRAYALPGYRLIGDRTWQKTVNEAEPCPTPTPTPTVTVEPTPTPTPTPDPTDPDATEEPEPEPVPTVTQTNTRVVVVNNIPVPSRVDTGLGGLARR